MNATVSRLRTLAPLYTATFGRSLGESSIRTYTLVLLFQGTFLQNLLGLQFLILGIAAVPALGLAPLIGAVASSTFRRGIMLISGALATIALIVAANQEGPWLATAGLLAFDAAFFAACRQACVPDLVRRTKLPWPRVQNGLFFTQALGIALGTIVGLEMHPTANVPGLPPAVQLGVVGYGLSLFATLFVFVDPVSTTPFGSGLIRPFFRTLRLNLGVQFCRRGFVGVVLLHAIVFIVYEWLLPLTERTWFVGAFAGGALVGFWARHPFRAMGTLPVSSVGVFAFLLWAVLGNDWHLPAMGFAVCAGWAGARLLYAYVVHQPERTLGIGMAALGAVCALVDLAVLFGLAAMRNNLPATYPFFNAVALGLAFVFAVFAVRSFFRPFAERMVQVFMTTLYRIEFVGPGAELMPLEGPMLIIANHAAWFDPLWLAYAVPTATTPMMTSRFYDLPIVSWLMRDVVGTIRVPDVPMRRNAPEIDEAIAAVQKGDAVVMFPEGWLRRKEAILLKRFGRGAWQILAACPTTPTYPCWVEGGWGSFTSHFNGPPTKNKKMDFRRRIRIGVGLPIVLDSETLADHMKTRLRLMEAVRQARGLLGLPIPELAVSDRQETES